MPSRPSHFQFPPRSSFPASGLAELASVIVEARSIGSAGDNCFMVVYTASKDKQETFRSRKGKIAA